MSIAPVTHLIGWFLVVFGLAMFFPAIVDWISSNPDWFVFVASGSATAFFGMASLLATRQKTLELNLRQGFLLTTGSWIMLALFGAIPFAYSDQLPLDYTDAFFETMSGLTTTGSTVITGLDQAPPGILLWRALLQWFGGIGIIVAAVALFPQLKVGGMQLFRMESSDRSERAFAQVRRYTAALVITYFVLTMFCALFLRLAGMTGFEAIVHAMTTLSTGGYSTSDASIGHFGNHAIHWIITAFMLMGGMPFVIYIQMVRRGPQALIRDTQIRGYLTFLAIAIGCIAAWLWWKDDFAFSQAIREAAFNVVSVVTTTGYATTDYSRWGTLPFGLFFLLIFVGGCTGSTGGGIKIFRYQILWTALRQYVWSRVYPHGVRPMSYGGRPISADVVMGVLVFILTFLVTVAVTSMALEALGLDLVTALSGAVTAVANVGPGLGDVIGPAGNFATLPDSAKWVLSAAMLLGRLEFLTVLVLLAPAFWRG